ncbi:MAG TPA: DMT family transporter [Tepidisphaeraceae bacterium]|jgi:drug/metabolite transporter (DMT)-like permease|nr:DMT family transporter [Tepidisphaeraceae bacterium]
MTSQKHSTPALLLGTLAICSFSLTLPATRAAVPELGSIFVSCGRALVAAILAITFLLLRRESLLPPRQHLTSLFIISLGIVIGFPLFTALALRRAPSSHAAVFIGLLPTGTAVMAVLRAHERPKPIFWLGCLLGTVAATLFAISEGAGRPQPADLFLLLAILAGALGYAEAGKLSRTLGGIRVVCYALLLSAPFLILPVAYVIHRDGLHASPHAWLGFAYVSLISMFFGSFAWYHALGLGGVARIGQIQLLQPVLTLLWSSLLLHEPLHPRTILAALLVIAAAALATLLGRRK